MHFEHQSRRNVTREKQGEMLDTTLTTTVKNKLLYFLEEFNDIIRLQQKFNYRCNKTEALPCITLLQTCDRRRSTAHDERKYHATFRQPTVNYSYEEEK
ncbi:hypothetical protein CDAR_237421 [Caerostris darwini]|uniref:Uncharacterized protein n=1 Tax=Caerostris darwini TaxID=1538125 RepID=A0AAV4QV69_9ARAC|nr:hypothetical protein CDAR_237421 [Caerostris darwini]